MLKKFFFLSSPYYTINNLKKDNVYLKELKWLKKIINNIKSKKFIYLSSSNIYLKNHKIGKVKKKCEKSRSFVEIITRFVDEKSNNS